MRTIVTYPVSKAVEAGLGGGIVGALVMGGLALMMPINGQPFFVAAAMMINLSGTMAIAAGWMLHIIGLIVGAVFGVAVTKVNLFRITNQKRALGWGIGAGVLIWLIFFLPLMMISGMANMLGAMLMNMIFGGLGAHLVYGLVLGGIVGAALPRTVSVSTYKCPTCGAEFHSQQELREHSKRHTSTAQYKCTACGASFKSENELAQHAYKHKIPADLNKLRT